MSIQEMLDRCLSAEEAARKAWYEEQDARDAFLRGDKWDLSKVPEDPDAITWTEGREALKELVRASCANSAVNWGKSPGEAHRAHTLALLDAGFGAW